jgi:pyrimidine operon attenuation protein/uracil phosphoribosyltransferase
VRGFWLLVPTAITLTGRIDIDEHFNAKLSHLSCVGIEAGGPLLASLINTVLKKYDGKTMPLAAFPGDKLKMRDLHITVDDALRIDAQFGD